MSDVGRERAILRPAEARKKLAVGRRPPGGDLAPWVDYFWWVRWNTGDEPHVQNVIPQMCVHLAAETHDGNPRLLVNGILRTSFERTLVGTGHVIGVALRPGCFRPFLRSSVGALSDRAVPAGDVLTVDDEPVARELLRPDRTDDQLVDGIARYLTAVNPEHDPVAQDIAALAERAEQDRTIVRAEQLASLAGVSLRTLQRQFSEYVGIGPKWVIQRCRLLDVAAAAHSGDDVEWAALAVELGFSDQSHLTRAWTALVGEPPARYRARS